MNQDINSFSTSKKITPVHINFDEFNINEDSFKPMTKGLGFHQEQKKSSFKQLPKNVKPFGASRTQEKAGTILKSLDSQNLSTASKHVPTGLEAFYGAKGNPRGSEQENNVLNASDLHVANLEISTNYKTAPIELQLVAWLIDLLVISGFVVVTGALFVFTSGIKFEMFSRLISKEDLIFFTLTIFSIYYLFYFTILDLSASPGKTIMGIRLLKIDNANVSVRHTFTRALVSLLSGIVLFLPMLLDFQGRLSDTKLVK
jgi:uncharacterized RDD family membrane protein YckC